MPDPKYTSVDMKRDPSILLDTTAGLLQEGYAWVVKVPSQFGPGRFG